jgi:hypothetical protein
VDNTHPVFWLSLTLYSPDSSRYAIWFPIYWTINRPLMELCLNKSFDQLYEASDVQTEGHHSVVDTYQVAMDNIDEVLDEGGGDYGRVVQRCLRCESGIQESWKTLDFDRFRALVYEGVIAPLGQDLNQFCL